MGQRLNKAFVHVAHNQQGALHDVAMGGAVLHLTHRVLRSRMKGSSSFIAPHHVYATLLRAAMPHLTLRLC